MILNFLLMIVMPALGGACLGAVLHSRGTGPVRLGRISIAASKDTGLKGETFTPRMGLEAAAWGAGVLCAVYFLGLLCCAVTRNSITWRDFFDIWAKADAVHYRNLAELGYYDYIEDGQHLFLVFFPFYPWLVRLLHCVISDYALCGHLVSAMSYIAGCYMLARLVTEELGWRTGRMSLLLLSVYPFAFFFAGMFTESLFFFLSVTAFYLIRKHRYLWAGVVGALAALTRMQGALLLVAGGVEYCITDCPVRKLKARDYRGLWYDIWRKLLPLALTLAGVGIYLWLNYAVEGNPFQFSVYQREHWYQYMVPITKCLSVIWAQLFSSSKTMLFTTWLPDILVFGMGLLGLVYSARRLPGTWVAYYLVCILLNYSLSWPLSCGRYMACAFPVAVAFAAASGKRPAMGRLMACGMAVLQGGYAYAFLSGTSLW